MKKFLIPVAIFFVIAIGSMGVAVKLRMDDIQYERELVAHLASVKTTNRNAEGESGGIRVRIAQGNLGYIASALTRTERIRKLTLPDVTGCEAATVVFPDGAKFVIYELEKEANNQKDISCVQYTFDNRQRIYTIEGYGTMDRIRSCISLQGFAVENAPIK
ncbi:MAG: hypothetical protein ABT01_04240 [Clostridium sp. SCN 57-10]|nr:MAG: hypothetical protein ABT01_04240 [Clostridium sp. SCN 57-10]